MEKKCLLSLSFILFFGFAQSQKNTVYPMKAEYGVDEIDSSINYRTTPKTGTFLDTRDDKTYKTVKIGDQWWMAENMAFNTDSGCWAYDNKKSNSEIFGYLYTWDAAHKACPAGWQLPADKEWSELEVYLQNNCYNYGQLQETFA